MPSPSFLSYSVLLLAFTRENLCQVLVIMHCCSSVHCRDDTINVMRTLIFSRGTLSDCGRARLSSPNRGKRVIGGAVVRQPGKWPWMVALVDDVFGYLCGGVIINENYIATAAHCLIRWDLY